MEGIMARTVKNIEEIGAVALEVNESGRSQSAPQDTSIAPPQHAQHTCDSRSYCKGYIKKVFPSLHTEDARAWVISQWLPPEIDFCI
jgi:hypothetical protein